MNTLLWITVIFAGSSLIISKLYRSEIKESVDRRYGLLAGPYYYRLVSVMLTPIAPVLLLVVLLGIIVGIVKLWKIWRRACRIQRIRNRRESQELQVLKAKTAFEIDSQRHQ